MDIESLEVLKEIALMNGVNKEELQSEYFRNRFENYPENLEEIITGALNGNYLKSTSTEEIFITKRGRKILRKEYGYISLTGKVTSGLEKGKYFMSKKGYKKQFIQKLGIDPFEGTLNIKLEEDSLPRFRKLKNSRGMNIEGFKEDEEYYGELQVYPAEIAGIECALLIPSRSDYERTAEIISSIKLRKKLNLNDGDLVQILVKPW